MIDDNLMRLTVAEPGGLIPKPCSEPLEVRRYSKRMPSIETPLTGLYLSTMAQVYPEDRGANYAIREGRRAARHGVGTLDRGSTPVPAESEVAL